jgi:hypothetical protein
MAQTPAGAAVNVTGLPDAPPVALTLKSGLPIVLLGNAAKLIVWLALLIISEPAAEGAPVPVDARIVKG